MTDTTEFMREKWRVAEVFWSADYIIASERGIQIITGIHGRELADYMVTLHNETLDRAATKESKE